MAGRTDAEALEGLLAREHELLSAYEAALRRGAIGASLGEQLRDHERAHVRALEQTLAGYGARNPRASVPSPDLTEAIRDRESFARYAAHLERGAIEAYSRVAAGIGDPKLRQPLGSILTCSAAHIAALRESMGEPPLLD
jgi:rubrerythrin